MGKLRHQIGWVTVGLAIAASCVSPSFGAEPKTVKSITNVEYVIQKTNPPVLVVTADGEVPTGGWKNPSLTRVVYVTPPADGIQDYTFRATPPDGVATQVITPIKATNNWTNYAKEAPWLKGVRIHGEGDGVKTVMLSESGGRPGGGEKFSGTSKEGKFQEALDAAIAEASKKLSQGGADIQIEWKFDSASGVHGGITGERSVTVTITAKRR